MDGPRRWQVASLATAVASLGLGAGLLARPAVDSVPSIDLDHVDVSAAPPVQREPANTLTADPAGPAIVIPRGVPLRQATAASQVSPADEDEPGSAAPATADSPVDSPTSVASPDGSPARGDSIASPDGSPTRGDSIASPDGASVDSAGSIDSSG